MNAHTTIAPDTSVTSTNPLARIVAALHRRGQGASEPAANLPALIAELPGDDTRAPQTQFTLDLQIAFLEALAVSGSVRSAARQCGRRACIGHLRPLPAHPLRIR